MPVQRLRLAILIIFGTGWRGGGATTTVMLGEETLTPVFAGAQGRVYGFGSDQPGDSCLGDGQRDAPIKVTSGTIVSNTATVNIQDEFG